MTVFRHGVTVRDGYGLGGQPVWLCAVSAYAVSVYAVCVCYSACNLFFAILICLVLVDPYFLFCADTTLADSRGRSALSSNCVSTTVFFPSSSRLRLNP